MSAITDSISTALPYVFVIGSGSFVARFLRPELRRSGWTLAVVLLAVAIGAFWGYFAVGFVALARSVPWSDVVIGVAAIILLTVAGSLDAWTIATRSGGGGPPALLAAAFVGVLTAPAAVWTTYEIASTGRTADARASQEAVDRAISDRSAPMSLAVLDAVVMLDGPVPTYGPGAEGVDGKMRLRVDLVSTSAISVDAGSGFGSVEVKDPEALQAQAPAEFFLDSPPLPPVIPVGTTQLDLTLDGGANAGGDPMSESAVWTVRLQFNWSAPGTGYLVTQTFEPTFAP
jgi:hypothetical protein